MEKTTRDLVIEQIELQERIVAIGLNIVTCGNCGTIILHELSDENILCFGCNRNMSLCDCPDLYYSGMENNYDDSPIVSRPKIIRADVLSVAQDINKHLTDIQISEVLEEYELKVVGSDDNWVSIVEDCIYEVVNR